MQKQEHHHGWEKTMKILVIGTGAIGSVITSELAKNPEVEEVKVADINLQRAEQLRNWLKNEKVSAHRVDASKSDDIVRIAKDVNMIVNATLPRFNITIFDAAFRAKTNYVDLAMYDYSSFLKQLEPDEKWKEAGLTALLNAGSSPGITNVLAAHAADKLDRVDTIRIKIFDSVESKEIVSTWSPKVMWEDMATKPVVYENGEFKRVPIFSGEETYTFPDPIGPQTVVSHVHEEPSTLPRFIKKGLKYVDFKMGTPDIPIIKFVVQLGLLNEEPVDVKGVKVTPRDLFFKLIPPTLSFEEVKNKIKAGTLIDALQCYVVQVEGEKAGKKVNYVFSVLFPSLREVQKKLPGSTHESYVTGISGAIFTEMVCMGNIKAKGVFLPECFEAEAREIFMAKLAEKGIKIAEKVEMA
ncbi:MAG: saccharopine dehydrogenase NADP-binding domain-containing protein [Candidatus Bathyarchaeota archaeon]|nr:MAG: saccharopine dehydrogenase NADP-binding domain-containing protein [Candidatus Bathyarchaeota archaeon]